MEKGDNKTNKAIEFLYKLSTRSDFINDIKEIKKKLKIPDNGFKAIDDQERLKWFKKTNTLDLMKKYLFIREKYSIPIAYNSVLQEYIETGKLETKRKQDELSAFIDPVAHIKNTGNAEDYFREIGEPFAKIIILGNNSKTDVINFIDNNWEKIEDVFLEQGHIVGKRVRKSTNKNRDSLIIELSRKPIKELRDRLIKKGGSFIKGEPKENIISKLLPLENKTKPYYAKSGYIRKIIQKNRIK
jgi:hypothetical protein